MRHPAGFTLIELLVVIVILGILISFVTVAVHHALIDAREKGTVTMLGAINGALESYRIEWGDYPPSSLDELGESAPNDVNNGIEALVACLSSTSRGRILYMPPTDEHFTNLDGDSVGRNVTGWFFGNNELREYNDYFSHTIVYLHARDCTHPRRGVLKYRFSLQGQEAFVPVMKSPQTGTFLHPRKYQLWSVGRDGKPGTGDDLRTFN